MLGHSQLCVFSLLFILCIILRAQGFIESVHPRSAEDRVPAVLVAAPVLRDAHPRNIDESKVHTSRKTVAAGASWYFRVICSSNCATYQEMRFRRNSTLGDISLVVSGKQPSLKSSPFLLPQFPDEIKIQINMMAIENINYEIFAPSESNAIFDLSFAPYTPYVQKTLTLGASDYVPTSLLTEKSIYIYSFHIIPDRYYMMEYNGSLVDSKLSFFFSGSSLPSETNYDFSFQNITQTESDLRSNNEIGAMTFNTETMNYPTTVYMMLRCDSIFARLSVRYSMVSATPFTTSSSISILNSETVTYVTTVVAGKKYQVDAPSLFSISINYIPRNWDSASKKGRSSVKFTAQKSDFLYIRLKPEYCHSSTCTGSLHIGPQRDPPPTPPDPGDSSGGTIAGVFGGLGGTLAGGGGIVSCILGVGALGAAILFVKYWKHRARTRGTDDEQNNATQSLTENYAKSTTTTVEKIHDDSSSSSSNRCDERMKKKVTNDRRKENKTVPKEKAERDQVYKLEAQKRQEQVLPVYQGSSSSPFNYPSSNSEVEETSALYNEPAWMAPHQMSTPPMMYQPNYTWNQQAPPPPPFSWNGPSAPNAVYQNNGMPNQWNMPPPPPFNPHAPLPPPPPPLIVNISEQ